MKIKMGVLGRNASGEPDVFAIEVECTDSEYVDGHHYDFAMSQADANGFAPAMAFDENDPAWTAMASRTRPPEKVSVLGLPMEEVQQNTRDADDALRRILQTIGPAFRPTNDSVSGADLVEDIGNVCRDEFNGRLADLKFGVAYNGVDFAYGENTMMPIFNLSTLDDLSKAGWTTAELSCSCLNGEGFPAHEDLVDAAESALARGEKHGFTIGAENAGEVMREELALCGFDDLTPEFDPICAKAMMTVVERERSAARERGGA